MHELWTLSCTSNESSGAFLSIHVQFIMQIYDYDSKILQWISVSFFSGMHCISTGFHTIRECNDINHNTFINSAYVWSVLVESSRCSSNTHQNASYPHAFLVRGLWYCIPLSKGTTVFLLRYPVVLAEYQRAKNALKTFM